MLEHLRRAVDLAVRYDYEYWLKRESLNNPELFSTEEARGVVAFGFARTSCRSSEA